MKRLLSIPALIILFLTATVVMVLYFNFYKPRLLILHSYSRDYSWTRDVDTGIRRILDDKFAYMTRWLYMDTNLHVWPEYRASSARNVRRIIDQWQPDIILAVDDDAQKEVMKYYVEDPRIRIVFAGVNRNLTYYGYNQATNVTGLLERNVLSAVRDALSSITVLQRNEPLATGYPRIATVAKRDRPKTIPAEEIATVNHADDALAYCSLDLFCLRMFPHWQALVRAALISAPDEDENQVVRAFNWSPIQLANTPLASRIKRAAVNHPVPDAPTPEIERTVISQIDGGRIIHLGDRSEATSGDEAFIRAFDWHPLRIMESRLVETFPEWQAVVKKAKGRADFILTTHYRELARSSTDPTLVPPHEVVQWTVKNSPIPVMGTNGLFVEDGGYLAIGTSPFEQGEVAAQMVLDIIEAGATPQMIPVATSKEFIVCMRGSGMRAIGLSLPQIYEAFARASNNYFD